MKYTRLAKKYAIAFLRFIDRPLSNEERTHVKNAQQHFVANKQFMLALELPQVLFEEKKKALEVLCDKFELPDEYKKLTHILLQKSRTALFGCVLNEIRKWDSLLKKQVVFHICTSHEVDEAQKQKIENFIRTHIDAKLVCHYQIRSRLISGLRIESKTYLWERSIEKELRMIKQKLCNKGIL